MHLHFALREYKISTISTLVRNGCRCERKDGYVLTVDYHKNSCIKNICQLSILLLVTQNSTSFKFVIGDLFIQTLNNKNLDDFFNFYPKLETTVNYILQLNSTIFLFINEQRRWYIINTIWRLQSSQAHTIKP